MKIKDSKEPVLAFLTSITKNDGRKNTGPTRERKLLESLKNFAELHEYNEWLWLHLLNVQYDASKQKFRYMKDYVYKYNHNLSEFVTALNSRKQCSIDLIPKNVKISDFLSILYSKPLRQKRKPKFRLGDRIRISK